MKVPAINIPVASRPKDFATSGRWFTTMKVTDIEIHIPIPPHLGVTTVCVSRERTFMKAPAFMAKLFINGVIK